MQFLLFALIGFGPRSWLGAPVPSEPLATFLRWTGFALMLIGMALSVAGLLAIRRSLTALPYPTDNAKLVRSGSYAIVRHPIYTGLTLGAIGWALYWTSLLVLLYAAALFVLFDVKSRREERWLVERFPEYETYQRSVKKLIPWVY